MFSLESPYRGDSNKYTKLTISSIKRKSLEIIPNTIMSAATGFVFLGAQERDSRGIRAISVRATEVHLYSRSLIQI